MVTDLGGLAPHSFFEIILGQESDSDNVEKIFKMCRIQWHAKSNVLLNEKHLYFQVVEIRCLK